MGRSPGQLAGRQQPPGCLQQPLQLQVQMPPPLQQQAEQQSDIQQQNVEQQDQQGQQLKHACGTIPGALGPSMFSAGSSELAESLALQRSHSLDGGEMDRSSQGAGKRLTLAQLEASSAPMLSDRARCNHCLDFRTQQSWQGLLVRRAVPRHVGLTFSSR